MRKLLLLVIQGGVLIGCVGVVAAGGQTWTDQGPAPSASTTQLSLETFTGIGSTTRVVLQSEVQGAEDSRALLWAYQRKQDPPPFVAPPGEVGDKHHAHGIVYTAEISRGADDGGSRIKGREWSPV